MKKSEKLSGQPAHSVAAENISKSNEQPKSAKEQKKRKKRKSLFRRLVGYTAYTFLFLLLLLVCGLYLLLNSSAGLDWTLKASNRYIKDYVTIGKAKGRIGHELEAWDVVVTLPSMRPMQFDYLHIDWNIWALRHSLLEINSLTLEGAHLDFTAIEGLEKAEKEPGEPFRLQDIKIPVHIKGADAVIRNSTLKAGTFAMVITHFEANDIDVNPQNIAIGKSQADLHLAIEEMMDLPLLASLDGALGLENETLDLNLFAYSQEANIRGNELNIAFDSNLAGEFDAFDFDFDGRVDWLGMLNDPVLMKVHNKVSDQNTIGTYLRARNLTNNMELNSGWSYLNPLDLDLDLKMDAPHLSDLHPDFLGAIIGDLSLKGSLMRPFLDADLKAEGLEMFGLSLDHLLVKGEHDDESNAEIMVRGKHLGLNDLYIEAIHFDLNGDITEEIYGELLVERILKLDLPAERASKEVEKVSKVEEESASSIDREAIATLPDKSTIQPKQPNLATEMAKADRERIIFEKGAEQRAPTKIVEKRTPRGPVQGEVLVDSIHYTMEGPFEKHALNLAVKSPFAEVFWEGIGIISNLLEAPDFIFVIEDSAIKLPEVGSFTLSQPATMRLDPEMLTTSSICYQQLPIMFCLEGTAREGINVGVVTLRNLPSTLLKPYLPEDLAINTSLNAVITGQYISQEDFIGVADISLAEGDLRYQLQGRELQIPLKSTFVRARAVPDGVESELEIDWGKYLKADGDGKMTSLFTQNRVTGSVTAEIPSYDWVAPLFPYLQELGGEIGLNADVKGTLDNPTIRANFSVKDGRLFLPNYNARFRNINLTANLPERSSEITLRGNVGTEQGTLNVNGRYNLANLNASVTAEGENLVLANSNDIRVVASPNLSFTSSRQGHNLTGTLRLPEVLYIHNSFRGGGSVIHESPDTVVIGDGVEERQSSFMELLSMNLNILLGDTISVGAGRFLGDLSGGLKLTKERYQPLRALGVINVGQGEYSIYGQRLMLDRGKVQFSGVSITNPVLDFQASREFELDTAGRNTKVGVKVTGNARQPKIELFSSPMMSEIEIVSYLFLGRSPNLDSTAENLMLLNMVRKIASGEDPAAESVAEKMGLTDFGFVNTPEGKTGIGLGKKLSDKFYVGLGVGLEGDEGAYAMFRYKFLKYFNLNTEVATERQGINLNYTRDF